MTAPCVAVSMPALSGHVNPTLGVARSLVKRGCRVEFMCTSSSLRGPVTATGASFHLAADWQPELYGGRRSEPPLGATGAVMRENGVVVQGTHAAAAFEARLKVSNIMLEMQLPGMLRFLRHTKPDVVVYDAMVGGTRDAFYAARVLGIPTVCILTVAGPGGNAAHLVHGGNQEAVRSSVCGFEPHLEATRRLRSTYPDLDVPILPEPVGMLEVGNSAVLVTTSEKLADPMAPNLAAAYEAQGASFFYLGPLLDEEGAPRAGASVEASGDDLLALVQAARRRGRRVALVSMGTVLTSDVAHGWSGRPTGDDGQPRGLNGCELCQSAWAGAFDALGAESKDEGPLLLVALGSRPGALGDLAPPPNAMILKSLPQVDVLRLGVDVFLTHGGQNSFTEAMANAAPVVVCPGFGDQIINSARAEALGVGLKVDRPDCDAGGEQEAAAAYRRAVAAVLAEVLAEPSYKEAAGRVAAELESSGGAAAAAEVILDRLKASATELLDIARNSGA